MGTFGKNLIRTGLLTTIAVAVVIAFLPAALPSHGTGSGIQAAFAAPPSAIKATTVLTTCTEAALKSAISPGGVISISYGVSCTVPFSTALTIPSTSTITITGLGFTVYFSGQSETRLFVVAGGSLTINFIDLESARFTAAAGSSGTTCGRRWDLGHCRQSRHGGDRGCRGQGRCHRDHER
jgi:hypothetical protein